MDFAYSKKNDKLIPVDLSKKTKLKDPQQVNFIGKLERQKNGSKCFSSLKNQKKLLWIFTKLYEYKIKMETQKDLKFAKQFSKWIFKIGNKKMYVIDSESIGGYSHHNSIRFLTKSISSDLCDYCDAYILVIKNIVVAGADNNTKVAPKLAPFRKCKTEKNDTLVDEEEFIDIVMPMYNLIE